MSHPAPSRPPAPANPTRQQLDELDALLERMLALPVNQMEEALELTRNVPSAVVTLQAPEAPADGPVARLFDATFTEITAAAAPAATVHGAVAETPSRFDPVVEAAPAEIAPAEMTEVSAREIADRSQAAEPAPPVDAEPTPTPFDTRGAGESSTGSEPFRDRTAEELPPAEVILMNSARPGSLASLVTETRSASAEGRSQPHSVLAGFVLPLVWVNRAFDLSAGRVGPLGRFLQGTAGRRLLGWTGLALLAAAAAWGLLDWFGWTR